MKRLFGPAITVMNRLKYPQKFAIISFLFALPLVLVMYFLISEINDRIDFAQKEIFGDAYLRPLRKLLEHVPQHSMLAHGYLVGSVSIRKGDLLSKAFQIDADFKELGAIDHLLGKWLATTERFHALQANWQDLKEKVLTAVTPSPNDSDALHTRLIADVRALISYVGDSLNLILDPDLDSYYLMDGVLLKLPEGQDLLAQARSMGEDIVVRKTLRDRQKITTSLGASLLVQWCSSTRHETGLESWLTSPVRHPRL